MSTQRRPRRPLSRRIQARVMGIVNVPLRRVLALPFATPLGNRLMLVYLTGRKTGRSYRQPVSYVRHGENLLTPGGGNWKLNLVEGQPVRIRLRGTEALARPEIISNSDDVERLLGVMIEANPMAGRFVRVPRGPDGRCDREKLEAALRYGSARCERWPWQRASRACGATTDHDPSTPEAVTQRWLLLPLTCSPRRRSPAR